MKTFPTTFAEARNLTPIQILTLVVGTIGSIFMVIGVFSQNEWYNFLGSFIGRVAGVLFITALYNKFPWWVGIPIMLSLAAVVYDNDSLYWTSVIAHMTVYRITAYKTFTELNRKNEV